MRNARIVCAAIVLAATVVGALWVYTYRVWGVVEYIQYIGQTRYRFHATEHVRETPWWSAPASVALIFLGAATVLWLLPERRSLIRQFTDRLAKGNRIVFDR